MGDDSNVDERRKGHDPEQMWQTGFSKCGGDCFHDGAIGTFRHAILLWAIARRVMWRDAGLGDEVGEFVAHELTAFVVLERIHLATSLVLHVHLEHQKHIERFRLLLEWIGGVIRGCVVMERDEVVVARHGRRGHLDKIAVDEIENASRDCAGR